MYFCGFASSAVAALFGRSCWIPAQGGGCCALLGATLGIALTPGGGTAPWGLPLAWAQEQASNSQATSRVSLK